MLYLMRHGAIEITNEKRFVGQIDPPLSPEGRKQAERQGRQLMDIPFTGIWCSDLTRSRETAAIVSVNLGIKILQAPELREIDLGQWDGMAMAEGAPVLHAKYPGNICAEVHSEFGDVEAAFAGCDLIKTTTFKNKRQDAACIEPQGCIASYDHAGNLTLYSATQVPHYVQRTVAMVLKLPVGKVRVIKPYVGAGFGIKASANPLELSACLLSMKTGKPVKMNYNREQVFQYGRARHQFTHTMTTGVKKDGTILALKHLCYLDGGAYSSFGIATVYYAGSLLGGPYKLPWGKGIGMACGFFVSGAGFPIYRSDTYHGTVVIKLTEDGGTALRTRYIKEHRGWTDNPEAGPLTFREAARMAYLAKGSIVGTGKYKPPVLGGNYKGATVGTSPAYGCSAQIAEVTVDEETGRITVDRITDAHDCGRAINVTSVLNAVYDAIGVRIHELPMTPERVYLAIQEAKKGIVVREGDTIEFISPNIGG